MEPVGMINASATKDLKSRARMKATAKLSRVSRKTCGGGLSEVDSGTEAEADLELEVDEAIFGGLPRG